MTWLDRIILLAVGLVVIYLLWRLVTHYQKSKVRQDIYYIISFAVLLVAGLLLIIFGFEALDSPYVVTVAVLIPAGLSLGLVAQLYPRFEIPYLVFVVVGLAAIAITRLTGASSEGNPSTLATIVLIIVHLAAGLLIFILPIIAVVQKRMPGGFIGVTVGGALIGLGGIALAFLKTGNQLLFFSADFVFTILAPLLLLMTLAFTWGLVTYTRTEIERAE